MILLKNTASQVVYAKMIDTTTSKAYASYTPIGDLIAYISKDGGAETPASNAVSEVGNGIYKLTLTQSETNCSTGVINFVNSADSTYQFETLYFQTTEANPSVNVLQNNDKTGYFLDDAQTFTTTGSVGSVTDATSIETLIRNSSYDGITQVKIYEMILAFMAGKVVITQVDPNTRLISYKKRDGTTERFNVTVSTVDGSRTSGGTIGA
jgi:hypothetical protein